MVNISMHFQQSNKPLSQGERAQTVEESRGEASLKAVFSFVRLHSFGKQVFVFLQHIFCQKISFKSVIWNCQKEQSCFFCEVKLLNM